MVVLLYLVLLIVEGFCEAYLLRRLNWTSWPKALLFGWLSNLIGFGIGFSIAFVAVGVTFALAWDGTLGRLPFHGNEAGVLLVVVALLLPLLLTLIKRLMFSMLSIGKGERLWLFAIVSSLIFWIVPLVLVILVVKVLILLS
jgi:hypothetical protein